MLPRVPAGCARGLCPAPLPRAHRLSRSSAAAVPDGSQYFVLLIITDGVISDMAQTKEAIVNVSAAPRGWGVRCLAGCMECPKTLGSSVLLGAWGCPKALGCSMRLGARACCKVQ